MSTKIKSNVSFRIGQRYRVQGGFSNHSYKPNTVYTVVEIDTSDCTLRGKDESGASGNWVPWANCVPHEVIGWDFLRTVLPTEALELLSAFEGLHWLTVKEEVRDRILAKIPNLHAEILAAVGEIDAARTSQTVRDRRSALP